MADKLLAQAKAVWKAQSEVRKACDDLVKQADGNAEIEKLAKLMQDNARMALLQAQKIVEKLGG